MVVPCAGSPTDCSGWPVSCSNGECYSTPIMVRQLPRRLRRSLGSPLASDLAGGRALRASVGQEATSGTGRLAPARSLLGHGATLAREGKTRHVGSPALLVEFKASGVQQRLGVPRLCRFFARPRSRTGSRRQGCPKLRLLATGSQLSD